MQNFAYGMFKFCLILEQQFLGSYCYFLSSLCDLKINWVNYREIPERCKCKNASKNRYQ